MNKILRKKILVATFVAITTFAVFLPSLWNGFINWDDNDYVYNNNFIRVLDSELLKSAFGGFYASNWHPLTWLSHAFDYAIWGLNPFGHHLVNNILHSINTFLVILLAAGLIEVAVSSKQYEVSAQNSGAYSLVTASYSRFTLITAATTGLLFGLHPIHVESVAWVAERKDLLCALFYLLSVMTYMRYAGNTRKDRQQDIMTMTEQQPFNKSYLLSLCFFALALMSKPMAVSLPLVLLILDWCPFNRISSLKTLWISSIEKLPFFALSLISSILTVLAQESGGSIRSVADIPLASRMILAAKSPISYLVKMTLPLNLTPFYAYPGNVSLLSTKYILPVVIVAAVTAACIAAIRKQRLWIGVWSYYLITLLPVLGIVQVGDQAMADRYAYLPSIGPLFVIGLTAAIIYKKISNSGRLRVVFAIGSFLIATAIVVSLAYATITQLGIWKDSIAFWKYVIEKEPSLALAHNNLGQEYISRGRFDMAIEEIRTALTLKPNDAGAYSNLGAAYFSKGLFDTAMEQYRTALRLKPAEAGFHYNIGYAYLSRGQFDKAVEHFRIALSLRPNEAEAHNNLGIAYFSAGQFDRAIEQYRTALSLTPNLAEVHFNLGEAYFSAGQFDRAIEQYRRALSLTPELTNVHYKLGLSYMGKGSKEMARAELELELKNKPDNNEARQALTSIDSR